MELITLDQVYDCWYKYKNREIYFLNNISKNINEIVLENPEIMCNRFEYFINIILKNNFKII